MCCVRGRGGVVVIPRVFFTVLRGGFAVDRVRVEPRVATRRGLDRSQTWIPRRRDVCYSLLAEGRETTGWWDFSFLARLESGVWQQTNEKKSKREGSKSFLALWSRRGGY